MPSQKLVRCEIARPGEDRRSVRFVPLSIFGLWRFLMERRHGFAVHAPLGSLWVESAEAGPLDGDPATFERVVEVRLFTLDEADGSLQEVCRYVPERDLERVRTVLLDHYAPEAPADERRGRILERPGLWFRPPRGSGEPGAEAPTVQ